MSNRITYIDSLKGLAIFLMVMGHVIARQFPDYQIALANDSRSVIFLWRFIYSFHMPLFMFCSGLLALRIKEYTWKVIGNTIWKRACTLLLPFFVTGAIRYWTQGGEFLDYWYLWSLFQFMIVVIAIDGLCSLLPKYNKEVSTGIIVLSALMVHVFWNGFMKYENMPFVDVWHWNLYPYFCMGIICARYDLCTKWFSKNWLYTCSLLVFGILTYVITIKGIHIPKQSLTGCLMPISAIIMLVYLFNKGLSGTSKLEQCLQKLGQNSLEIYILHSFFLFPAYKIGEYVIELSKLNGGYTAAFMLQLTSSLLFSALIIVLCYGVMGIIKKSNILSQILLGRKGEIK